MAEEKILLVLVGHSLPEVIDEQGDFDLWFQRGLGVEVSQTDTVAPIDGDALPAPERYAGVVVSGSSSMVTEAADWSERTAQWLRLCVEQSVPVLGVCYGHQLLGHALGAEVGNNPAGREFGTISVALDAGEDPLFGELPNPLVVQASHRQSVLSLPENAVRLGQNAHDDNHVVRFGPRAWGVQFHPEMDGAAIAGYIEARRAAISDEGLDVDALLAEVRDSDHGDVVLQAFARLCGVTE